MIFRNIQALRAMAANAVLVSHLLVIEHKYGRAGPALPDGARCGAFGVDLFFVISGFIIVTIARNAFATDFLASRVRRIYPPYWFYTTLVLIVSLVAPATVNSSFTRAPSLWRSYMLIPDSVEPLLAVGWTLIHEMYFYLCFAGILVLSRKVTLPLLLLAWSAAVVGLNLLFRLFDITHPVAAMVTHPLTLEFVSGAITGLLIQHKVSRLAALALTAGIVTLSAVLAFPTVTADLIVSRGWMRPLLVGLPCALIVYGCAALEVRAAMAAPSWLVAIGNASYSTYLGHVLVLSAIGRLFAMLPGHTVILETGFIVICVVAANVIGLVSCRLIERR